jgi:hypothetical protein
MGNWVMVTNDVTWAIREGRFNGNRELRGRGQMQHAVNAGNPDMMGEYEEGFVNVQHRNGAVVSNFQVCKDENPRELYNIGRTAMGLPKV